MTINEILSKVSLGSLSVEEAETLINDKKTFVDYGFARIDTDRKRRSGNTEVVFCQGKPDEFLVSIYQKIYESSGEVLGTRATKHQYDIVKEVIPEVTYDEVSRILCVKKEKELLGRIAVCTGGTADIPVAEEAARTAEFLEVM